MKPIDYVARWHLGDNTRGDARDVVITIPLRTVSESNQREHWAKKAKRVKSQRLVVGLTLRPILAAEKLGLPVTVTLTRIAPRALDDDNLRGALKATRDSVAEALGVDDRDPRVAWEYDQRRGRPKEYAIAIAIAQPATRAA